MTTTQNASGALSLEIAGPKETKVFGVPIGRLGLVIRVMIGGACGFISFFIAFVLAIIGVSIYDSVTGTSMANLNVAYLYIAAPVGIVVMAAALVYLVSGWARRKMATGQ